MQCRCWVGKYLREENVVEDRIDYPLPHDEWGNTCANAELGSRPKCQECGRTLEYNYHCPQCGKLQKG